MLAFFLWALASLALAEQDSCSSSSCLKLMQPVYDFPHQDPKADYNKLVRKEALAFELLKMNGNRA
jgi:hypothetical protein